MAFGGSAKYLFQLKLKDSKDIYVGGTISGFFQQNTLTSTIGSTFKETLVDFSL